jgi:hypothetical protein
MVPVIQANTQDNITFSSENLLNLELPVADIVICKNTLHHMNTVNQIGDVLGKLKELGKKVVIMDVEDPKLTVRARLWNAYYIFMLKDQGGFFINFDQFSKVINVTFDDYEISTRKIKTIKGFYMLAVAQRD